MIRDAYQYMRQWLACRRLNRMVEKRRREEIKYWKRRQAPERWQEVRYPLLEADFTRGKCEQWLKANGYAVPPRSRCIICPYRSDESWRQLTPEEFEQACVTDDGLREGETPPRGYGSLPFLHRQRVPLRQVDFTPASFGLPLEDNEEEDCFGGCGT